MPNQEPAFAWPFGNGPVRVGTQGLFRMCLKTFVAHFPPARLTAPGSPRMRGFIHDSGFQTLHSMHIFVNKHCWPFKRYIELYYFLVLIVCQDLFLIAFPFVVVSRKWPSHAGELKMPRVSNGFLQLISSWVSVRMSRYWGRGKCGEHEGAVRVARGAAEGNSSLLSAPQTSQVLNISTYAQPKHELIVSRHCQSDQCSSYPVGRVLFDLSLIGRERGSDSADIFKFLWFADHPEIWMS